LGKFPKNEKHTLGQTIELNTLKLLEEILFVGSSNINSSLKRDKLTTASNKLDLIKLLIRLSYDIKAIDQKGYISLQEMLQEIGKMLGGWIRSIKT
jgi:hypothetical protein